MTDRFRELAAAAVQDLGGVAAGMDEAAVAPFLDAVAQAKRIALYGVGREGLQIKGFCMRLFHLGCDAHMVGDMTTPPVGPGDLLIVSAGPGDFSTVSALMGVAKRDGAKVAVVTAQPGGAAPQAADVVLHIPAQTMADDTGAAATSVLPMGSLYEGAQYVVFEVLILMLRDRLAATADGMRSRHTNLE
ncbi:MAG: SIS domain-containing protein [Rhodospirillaceae bacterium]|nr:SIS domain-containing protein [Rhodospirillaceae bacterium]